MNQNSNMAAADVQKIMGHAELSTTYHYTHSNENKKAATVSVFDRYYEYNNEFKINFNLALSLYSRKCFTTSEEIDSIMNLIFKYNIAKDTKYDIIKEYLDSKYPIFSKIKIDTINLDNVWEILEKYKNEYGNEYTIENLDKYV